MNRYALYLDPSVADHLWQEWPTDSAALAYYRLTDLTSAQLEKIDIQNAPMADYTIAEINPQQWDKIPFAVDRLCIAISKGTFSNIVDLKQKVQTIETDIMFDWDHRFALPYYIKLLNYWIYCGVPHFSFYGLQQFDTWQRLQQFLQSHGYFFYDRYHAAQRDHQSLYQKHVAESGNLFALGGWSRWSFDSYMATRGPKQETWEKLSPEDARLETLLFGMADRHGMAQKNFAPHKMQAAIDAGLAVLHEGMLRPTDQGLWDTLKLVSHLQ